MKKYQISVLLLAGGRSSRMGGTNKALINYKEKPMLEHLLAQLPDAVDKLIISCNSDQKLFENYTQYLVNDDQVAAIEAYSGPLLGILSALQLEQDKPLLILPCDTPEITLDIIQKLIDQHFLHQMKLTCASVENRVQALHSIIEPSLKENLHQYLLQGGRRAQEWVLSQEPNIVDCSEYSECFKNVNYPKDIV